MDLLQSIDRAKLPKHIAIIMDGNGRWAKERGEDRVYGHHEGVISVREIVNGCANRHLLPYPVCLFYRKLEPA